MDANRVTICVWLEFPQERTFYKKPATYLPQLDGTATLGDVWCHVQQAGPFKLARLVFTAIEGEDPEVSPGDKRSVNSIALQGQVHMRAYYAPPTLPVFDRLRRSDDCSESF